ncbi:peptide chain release factor N(5)-glutamine methyltransferase [Allopusillimonas ginsengisoli]|uniref:peptide chain release factor N(5)-glutamine methyltransferase n=1 Tax=Allopusillimonas ginsengisoli TaxID=453575 RepID=UPI0039C21513
MDTLRVLLRENRLPRLEMRMLWQHVLQVPRSWLIAHDTDTLDPEHVTRYRQLERRRLLGEPMAYILGYREFMSREFQVTPDVLIPRPETEVLVETALSWLGGRRRRQADTFPADGAADAGPSVLDLGTGTGVIAISMALEHPGVRVTATDASAAALRVARENAKSLRASVEFLTGNWYDALSGTAHNGFDLIISNPPYIDASDPHLSQGDLRFEPGMALTDGKNGLSALKIISAGAGKWLKKGGALFVEHGWVQAEAVRGLLRDAGFSDVDSVPDLAGIPRVTGGIYN